MAIEVPDIGMRLKPDLFPTVQIIYRDMCNLRPGERVLIIADARAPEYLIATFHGVAMMMGGDVAVIEGPPPRGGATYQPSATWSPMIAAASREADLIIDFAVGYADFIVEAVKRGARVFSPGDGIALPYTDDVLIRTILHTDVHAIRRRADRIAELFSAASLCTMTTGDAVLEVDISGIKGMPGSGFLWDPDSESFRDAWAFAPPAQPGVLIPEGRATGEVLVDGTLLYHPVYHAAPPTPLRLRFDRGRLVDIGGDPLFAGRLRTWLDQLGDEGAFKGPVHLNLGINPNALLTQHPEWERVMGSVTCGMGDLSLLGVIMEDGAGVLPKSTVHWDWTTLRPTIMLDDVLLVKDGIINEDVC
ncbi:hypothetical protein [Sphingomonas colocasiae]|uniref:Leucyl aminopeptidase n=1 Tax=Sphingomonas colocasiae TaxID=1848973 RepID=A0ABS7PYA0_9SPHN|nr:hypothetical protein [Sphingomonas colocasiae]MBY8826332.1 hypothetical protein [Sphingomonas colocasiae]